MFGGPLVTVTVCLSLAPEVATGASRAHQPWRLSVQLSVPASSLYMALFSAYVRFIQKVGL
jgi:hypothetical protein